MDNWSIKQHHALAITGLRPTALNTRKIKFYVCVLTKTLPRFVAQACLLPWQLCFRMLLNNLKGERRNMKEQKKREEKKSSLAGTVTKEGKKKGGCHGGRGMPSVASGFSHFNLASRGLTLVAPEWAGPGSQGLAADPQEQRRARGDVSLQSSPGSTQAAKHFKSPLPIQPKFQLNGHRAEGGATAIKTGCKRRRICFQNVFGPLTLASKTSGPCLWSRPYFSLRDIERKGGRRNRREGGHGALSG